MLLLAGRPRWPPAPVSRSRPAGLDTRPRKFLLMDQVGWYRSQGREAGREHASAAAPLRAGKWRSVAAAMTEAGLSRAARSGCPPESAAPATARGLRRRRDGQVR